MLRENRPLSEFLDAKYTFWMRNWPSITALRVFQAGRFAVWNSQRISGAAS
jgi:hypothetical protein